MRLASEFGGFCNSSDSRSFGSAESLDMDENLKVRSEYVEQPVDSFSKIFSAYKRQSAGVVKEYKNKQEYRSRSEWRKIKDENSRKRNAKKSRGYGLKNGRYF